MIEPINVDLAGLIGGTFDTTITLYSDAAQTEIFPVADWTWQMTIERIAETLTEGSGLTVNAETGSIVVKLTPEQTSELEPGKTHAVLQQTSKADATDVYFPVTADIDWATP